MQSVVERIDVEIERQSLLMHPFYQAWSEGKLTLPQLSGYSLDYFQLVKEVPALATQNKFLDSVMKKYCSGS